MREQASKCGSQIIERLVEKWGTIYRKEICVNLNGLELKEVPNFLICLSCSSLQKLNLDENFVKVLPQNFNVLQNLCELSLSRNGLTEFPFQLCSMPRLGFVLFLFFFFFFFSILFLFYFLFVTFNQ